MRVSDVVELMNEIASEELAADWDNVGLQVGDPESSVNHIAVTLELTCASLSEALRQGADMIVVHHPVLFEAAESLREDRPQGRLLSRLMKNEVAVYAAHTNLDSVDMGPSGTLARMLKLRDVSPLVPAGDMYKLAVFVPEDDLPQLRRVLADAGAGMQGNYSHCSFKTSGEGTFLPNPGAKPAVGEVGSITRVREARLEALCPGHRIGEVIDAVRQNHPYEEPAIDVYPLSNEAAESGMGRVGSLPEGVSAARVAGWVAEVCGRREVRMAGPPHRKVRRLAVCGGSGGDLYTAALAEGADIFVTGDITHHNLCEMLQRELIAIDAGHRATEQPAMRRLSDHLDEQCSVDVSFVHLPSEMWTKMGARRD